MQLNGSQIFVEVLCEQGVDLSLIHISEPTRH